MQKIWILVWLLLFVAIVLCIRLYLYKKQIYKLKEQILFIRTEDTNQRLTLQTHFKDLDDFIGDVNHLIQTHRELEIFLEKTNRNFKETITSISHDIRTPLTSAIGYIQMLKKEDIPEEKRKEYIEIIQKRILAVKKMLDQLFEFARIESGELELLEETININNILRDSVSLFYDDYIAKGEEPEIVIPEKPYQIIGDKAAIKRVFENIIYNSLIHGIGKYGIVLEQKADKIRICFSNQTNSIEVQDIDCIFERFYTTDHSRTKKTTGLGLSIAKSLVERMNGSIQAGLAADMFFIVIEF